MTEKKYERDIAFIAGFYGEEHQLIQTAEECAELAQAAIKMYNALTVEDHPEARRDARAALIAEIADVLVMCEQIAYLEGCADDVRRVMDEKMQRQIGRIRDETEAAKQTAQPAPRWVEDEYGYCRCTRCGYEHDAPETTTPYCPECGARMDGIVEVSEE